MTRTSRGDRSEDQPAAVPDEASAGGDEADPDKAADAAADEPNSKQPRKEGQSGPRHRRPTKMSTPKDDGDRGDDSDPGGGGSDDEPLEEYHSPSSTRTSELRRLLDRGRPRAKEKVDTRQRASLGTVKLHSFEKGHRAYKNWKKMVTAEKRLYRLEEEELAMLM